MTGPEVSKRAVALNHFRRHVLKHIQKVNATAEAIIRRESERGCGATTAERLIAAGGFMLPFSNWPEPTPQFPPSCPKPLAPPALIPGLRLACNPRPLTPARRR